MRVNGQKDSKSREMLLCTSSRSGCLVFGPLITTKYLRWSSVNRLLAALELLKKMCSGFRNYVQLCRVVAVQKGAVLSTGKIFVLVRGTQEMFIGGMTISLLVVARPGLERTFR